MKGIGVVLVLCTSSCILLADAASLREVFETGERHLVEDEPALVQETLIDPSAVHSRAKRSYYIPVYRKSSYGSSGYGGGYGGYVIGGGGYSGGYGHGSYGQGGYGGGYGHGSYGQGGYGGGYGYGGYGGGSGYGGFGNVAPVTYYKTVSVVPAYPSYSGHSAMMD